MTKAKSRKRNWAPEEKAAAIVLLGRTGGTVKKTVREFRVADGSKVSESTLRGWRDNPAEQPPVELVDEVERKLDDVLEGTIAKIARGLDRPEAVARILAKPVQAATVLGILIDKRRVMRGEPTDVTEQRVSYAEPGSLRGLALKVIEGGRGEAAS